MQFFFILNWNYEPVFNMEVGEARVVEMFIRDFDI